MKTICDSCSGTGCSQYGPPPGNNAYSCYTCGGSGEVENGLVKYEAIVTVEFDLEEDSDLNYVKQIALERLYDELESEAFSLTLLE